MSKTKKNGGPAPVVTAELPIARPLPRLRPLVGPRYDDDGKLLKPREQPVYPSVHDDPTTYLRVPSIVVRVDGRYGVARLMRADERQRTHEEGYVAGLESSRSTGLVHEAVTYRTREEAEARAWKLARELGTTGDWP